MAIYQTHTIKSGETLGKIAKIYGLSVGEIVSLNSISNPNKIKVGQILKIKQISETYYTVARGDTLSKIAALFNVNMAKIIEANSLPNANKLSVGQKLIIPSPSHINTASSISPVRELGNLSRKYEVSSGGPGTVSTGRGDHGGVSYGSYQLASKMKRPSQFLKSDGKKYLPEFGNTVEGTREFSAIWKEIAKREPQAFDMAQHAYIMRTHYAPQVAKIKTGTGVDINSCSRALQDVTWSVAVQHGPSTSLISKVLKDLEMTPTDDGFDREAIIAIYGERGKRNASGNLAYFSSNSQAVQEGVAKRFRNELNDALAMLTAQTTVVIITPNADSSPKEIDALLKKAQKSVTDDEVRLLVEKYGDLEALNNFLNGHKLIIALRNPTNSKKYQKGRYDDPMLLVQRKFSGSVEITRFMGNTEPAGIYAWGQASQHKGSSTDIDKDGRNDLGRLCAGTYHYSPRKEGNFQGNKAFRARDIQVAMRDVNHDGDFSILEGDMIDKSGAGRSMLIHQGGKDFTWSAGCQTIYKPEFNRFLRTLGSQTDFSYILINVI